MPDEAVIRLHPPGLLNGNLLVDAEKQIVYAFFAQSLFCKFNTKKKQQMKQTLLMN